MTQEFKDFLKKISKAKWITLLLVILFLGVVVWRNIDFLTEVSFTIKKPEPKTETEEKYVKDKASGSPDLDLGEVILSPVPKKLPVIVVFEVKNSGSVSARQVRVFIDFGTARVIAYEVIGPKENFVSGSDPGSSAINLDIKYLRPHESAYIYAQTSYPVFSKIAISSSDTLSVVEHKYSDLTAKKTSPLHSFVIFLLILLSVVLFVMTIYFIIVLIKKLNKWLKVKWD